MVNLHLKKFFDFIMLSRIEASLVMLFYFMCEYPWSNCVACNESFVSVYCYVEFRGHTERVRTFYQQFYSMKVD